MKLQALPYALTVCKIVDIRAVDLNAGFFFLCRTDRELSLVCKTEETPARTTAREDGWRGFRVQGALDFSLIGILSGLTRVLAEKQISVFAVSTYDTDYLLVKKEHFARAQAALEAAGYAVEQAEETGA